MKNYFDLKGDGGSDIAGQVAAQRRRLRESLSHVRHVISVMSGKGGVGKSVITTNLAAEFSRQGLRLGVLDADINGPSIAKMLGVRDQRYPATEHGLEPASSAHGIRVMSMDLFLAGDANPVQWEGPVEETYVWRGNLEINTLRHFLTDTQWGELDMLLLDLPPGADRLQNLGGLLPPQAPTLIVSIASEVSQLVVSKSISMATQVLRRPVLGLIENMAGYHCQSCGEVGPLFSAASSVAELAAKHQVPFLGGVPFDARLATASDAGEPFVLTYPESPAALAIAGIASRIRSAL